jgi:hypothetical protein
LFTHYPLNATDSVFPAPFAGRTLAEARDAAISPQGICRGICIVNDEKRRQWREEMLSGARKDFPCGHLCRACASQMRMSSEMLAAAVPAA